MCVCVCVCACVSLCVFIIVRLERLTLTFLQWPNDALNAGFCGNSAHEQDNGLEVKKLREALTTCQDSSMLGIFRVYLGQVCACGAPLHPAHVQTGDLEIHRSTRELLT